jgi:hypothetical protein
MKNLDYYFLARNYFYEYKMLVWMLNWMSYIFGLRYLYTQKLVLNKITTVNSDNEGKYYFENGKWILNLNIKNDNYDKLMNSANITNKILNSMEVNKYWSSSDVSIEKVKRDSYISPQLVNSCPISNNKDNGVVDKNFFLHGTSNVMILGSSSCSNVLTGNSPLLYYLMGYLTIKNMLNKNNF